MVVKRKVPATTEGDGKIDLSAELTQVRNAIQELPIEAMDVGAPLPEQSRKRRRRNTQPTEEETAMPEPTTNTAADTNTTAPAKGPKKKVAKAAAAPAKGGAKKKAAAAAPVAKKSAPAPAADSNQVSLAELCKELKLEPAAARRRLRGAEGFERDGRWAWKANSPELKKVRSLLQPSK